MSTILCSILSQLRGQDYAHAGESQLIISQIRNFLKDKRYFVIIDDVWDVPTWQMLDCAFVRNGCGNVILTTTRILDVAKSCCSSDGDLVYKMEPLSVADSKMLFFKRIFGSEEKCPPNLKEASEGITKRCDGLPLAIHALSSLLATGKTKEEWEHVQSSIGFVQGKNYEIDAMHHILSLSYFDLPLHLRSCLLYLTMFPEDDEIHKEPLVYKWIAEGLIKNDCGEDLVELGESYFYELINRSLTHPVDIAYDGKVSSCQVHDIVLDFLIHKSTEENFCTRLHHRSKTNRRIHRLSLMGDEDQESVEQLDLSHARSLSTFGSGFQLPSLVKSNALRVLDLGNYSELGNHHLTNIGSLYQLRYLNICDTSITELPRQIGDLEFLETLNVFNTKLAELPESVTRLKRLARLFLSEETKLPDWIGNLENLKELFIINFRMQSLIFVEEISKLKNLRKLIIICELGESEDKCSREEKLVASLCEMEECKLHDLYIEFDLGAAGDDFMERRSFPALTSIRGITLLRGKLRWVTEWLVSFVNLEILTVDDSEIEQHDIDIVQTIHTRKELTLFPDFRGMMFEDKALPNLKSLHLMVTPRGFQFAGASGGFDFGIQHLSSLVSVVTQIECDGASAADVEAAEACFESMAEAHPNRPTWRIFRHFRTDVLPDE